MSAELPSLSMNWVDTHCHLQLDERPHRELVERAEGVAWMVSPGIDAESSRASVALADAYPGRVLSAAGLHPHDASKWAVEGAEIEALAAEVTAIGEIGLDFYRNLSPREAQEEAFRAQIHLAEKHDLPAIIHCRDAFTDVFRIIEELGVGQRVVLHSWTGGRKWTRRFLDLGVLFSFSGPIAFETGETIRLAAKIVPKDRAVVETDSPYLAPPPHRGEANEPAYVSLVGEALAGVWGLPPEEVAEITSENAARFFRK